MVLDALLRVIGDVGRVFFGGFRDCQFVTGIAFFGVDIGCDNLVCFQELQKVGFQQA